MVKAIWNGAVIAESDATVIVEGNHYFPPESVREDLMQPSDTHTTCGWKGTASYRTIIVDGKKNEDAAWFYPEPKEQAANVKDYFAFWKGVAVVAAEPGQDQTPDGATC